MNYVQLETVLRGYLTDARDRGVRLVSGKYDYPIGQQYTGGACLFMAIMSRNYADYCRDGGDLFGAAMTVLGLDRTSIAALNAGWEHWKKKRIDSTWDAHLLILGRKLADEFAVAS